MSFFNPLEPISQAFEFLNSSGIIQFGNTGYSADRKHTEEREDSVYQRGVEDMRKAGLSPYTIGSNPAPSSASNVHAQEAAYNLQMLGYILDLKNLSAKNRKITNDAIGDILGFLKK